MTDNEIIKALEWHSNDETHCSPCPYEEHSVTHYCVDKLLDDALSLIIRQKEEIERLKGWENLLKAEKHSLIKAAAIKEFAYRLRQRSYESSDWSHGEHPMVVEWSDIDEVLEETAGENNA